MNQKTKIEFYKNRTLSERFSAAADFIRQNWKVLLKNTMYIGIPLVLLQGFFFRNYMQEIMTNINSPHDMNINWGSYTGMVFPSLLLSLFLFSVIGAILRQCVNGSLTEQTGWSDLKGNIFSFMGKMFVQYLIISVAFVLLIVLMGLLTYVASLMGRLPSTIVIALIFLAFFALLIIVSPMLLLTPYPVVFENASAWQGLKKGFKVGFKHWGSTFLTVFLGTLLIVVIYYILSMPYFVYIIFNMGESGFVGYILSVFSSLVLFILYPVFFVFMSFQYTSIVEKEEGISLQDKIREFDNL
ncbi:MAG: hypothetical protein LBG15_16515 [Dysgonamonadaceae bacterium]|jgi:MFS family permease|nr:hypothetical protein [Dysgonamonadaceae bacterium]